MKDRMKTRMKTLVSSVPRIAVAGHLLIVSVVVPLGLMAMAERSTAQETQASKPAPCSAPEHRQFDFWLGEWDVYAKGKLVGHNHITAILGGCVLLEQYDTPSGYEGKSINRYDPRTERWEQTWVDNQGGVLRIAGRFVDGQMVLEGKAERSAGTILDRITWTPNEDGTVRQFWEQSADDGATWTTAFDGLYKKKS